MKITTTETFTTQLMNPIERTQNRLQHQKNIPQTKVLTEHRIQTDIKKFPKRTSNTNIFKFILFLNYQQ